MMQGSLAYFGTHSVSETDKTITSHVESCTLLDWNLSDGSEFELENGLGCDGEFIS